MQFLVSLQCLLQEKNLLLAFHSASSGIGFTLPVAFHAIKLNHFLNALEVLLFDLELELDLREHVLDSRAKVRGIVFDQVY
jgi:hypothetical protein